MHKEFYLIEDFDLNDLIAEAVTEISISGPSVKKKARKGKNGRK
jgi:hypothetical protein